MWRRLLCGSKRTAKISFMICIMSTVHTNSLQQVGLEGRTSYCRLETSRQQWWNEGTCEKAKLNDMVPIESIQKCVCCNGPKSLLLQPDSCPPTRPINGFLLRGAVFDPNRRGWREFEHVSHCKTKPLCGTLIDLIPPQASCICWPAGFIWKQLCQIFSLVSSWLWDYLLNSQEGEKSIAECTDLQTVTALTFTSLWNWNFSKTAMFLVEVWFCGNSPQFASVHL